MKSYKEEYRSLLVEYNSPVYSKLSTIVPKSEWSKPKQAEEYLEKYWLPLKEYEAIWKPIQNSMFINQHKGLPALKFTEKYKVIPLRGGILFDELSFKKLQKCIQNIGDTYFVVIENNFRDPSATPFRMKFPADITWQELMSGSYISDALFDYSGNEYFIFGESGAWGEYVANDYEMPLRLIGSEIKYSDLFREVFKESEEEEQEILTRWLPKGYLDK